MTQEMLELGVIKHVKVLSPLVVMVHMIDGTWWMYLDYREFNKYAIKDKFLILLISDL